MSDSSLTYGASGWDTLRTNTYTKGGYTFAGWATSEDGSVAYADGGPLTVSDFSAASGTLNLYAKWTANKYSVSFYGNYPNDATSTSSLIETKTNQTYNTNYTLPSSNPSYTGWTFAGWYDAATGGSEITGSTLITTAGNHNIYAHWTANTYTVRFHSNHDSDVTVDQDFTYDAAAAALTSTATLFNTANFEKSGWVFDEWTANADGTGTSYTDGQSVRNLTATVNGVYHIYAQWKQTYNVIYNANEATGGSVPTSHSNIDFGTGITVKGNTGSLYKNGYVFNGWNTADDGNGTHYAVDATPAAFNANTTLFAEWVADIYTIVLDNDSATSAGTTSIYEKYGVGYYLDSAASSQQMTASSNPITKPTKNGYVFGGYWTVDGGSGTKYIDENGKLTSSAVTTTFHQNSGTLKLYAKWTLGVYEIQLDNDSATSAGATSIYEKYNTGYYLNYSAEAVSNQMSPSSNPIDVPRKTGYTFGGYYTEENGNGTQYIDTNGNLTSSAVTTTFYDGITLKLYAKWTANKYTVTLNNEDADALTPGADSVTATYNDALPSIAANKPVRSGYTFGGYWTVAGGGGSMYIKADGTSNIDHYLIDGTTTLYAKWSRTVSLDGYSVDNTSTQNFTLIWHAVASGNITAPSKTGYTFGGYFTGTSGSGTKIFNANGTPANAWNVAGDTLHALWTANTYSVTLNGNDGTPASQSITATYDAAMPGTNTSSAALTIPTRTGYTFGGYWTSSNSGTTLVTQYYNDDLTSTKSWVETDVTVLYAKWTIKTTRITFNGNGNDSGSVPNSIDVNYGSVPSSLGATALVKAGYHFGGYWYSSNGGSTLSKRYFAPAGSFSQVNWDREEASITLYAQWIANDYKVRFYSNGGTGGPTTQTFTYDAAAQALTSFDSLSFANTGMHFVKWNTQSNGEGTDYSDGQSVRNLTTALNGYFDLYAVWAYNEYSVAFDKNDGGGSNGSQSGFVYNTSKALTAFESLSITAPTGMHFVGWATSSEGSKAYDDGDSLVTPTPTPSHNGTFTLYALWEYNTYTVTLDPSKNGVTVLTNGDTSTTATFNSAMRSITVPTADGYVFRGYYTGADGAGTKYYNQDGSSANTWNLTSDTTLHAKWELKTKFEQGDVIYYVPSDAWLASPEGKTTYTAAYFYTSSAPYYRWWVKFSDFTTVETSPRTLFSVTVPGNSTISTWDGMQFCRYDSTKDGNININAGPDDNTSNLWNYTSPFTYTAGKDLLYGVEDSNCSGSNTSWKIYRATMPSADRTYYYFDNTNTFTGGGKVPTAYIWSSNYYVKSYGIQYSAWPGTAMTQPDSTITRHENVPIEYVWYITIPSIYDHIIFDKGPGAGSSDPASQTANLTLGTGENQGQPNWFFVVTGEQDNNNNWTGRWAEAIYPVILHGVYFLDSTQITTNIVETGYSFGIEPYRPTGDYDDGYFYFGNGTTGVGYRFYSGATASYYTAATCANNERFVIGTNAVDGLTFSEGSYHLYVKYTSSSEDYKTVYIDARASGNRNDPNSYWTGIHVTVWTDASTRIDLFEAGSSSVYYLTDFFYKVTLHEGLVFAIDNGITPFSGSHSTVKNITVDADTDYLFIYENNAGQNCTIGWFDKIVHNIGTATIYTSTNSGSTWTPQGTMGIGDLTQNFFIFERGVKIAKNTWVKITISGSTNLSLPDGDYVYANLTSGDNGKTAAYLTSESGNIKINVDNGRFTFYLTASSEIAIAKVPYKGNGFYIMPTTTSGNTDGYDNYIKMLTKSEDKGTYEGFNIVIENETPLYYYVRSYMNAHDVLYTSISLTPGIVSDVILEKDGESKNTGIIKFTKSGTYTFVVKGSTLTISEFAINDFFKLNGLDKNAIDSQNAIKDQKTSLVLEVKLAANNNAAIKLKVTPRTNTLTPYVGFSVFATTKSYDDLHTEDSTTYAENDVYHYMRENCYSLGTFAQTATTVIPAKTSGSVYLYILVDYLYSASLSDMPYNISGLLNFTVSIVQQ
ncbi:MAG: InlB B-repeat-containing protein [Bacilli bacterium]|nr:InlB B-repeat-containing protein [Bacilli bacterium]